jgi:hypothetical protein
VIVRNMVILPDETHIPLILQFVLLKQINITIYFPVRKVIRITDHGGLA